MSATRTITVKARTNTFGPPSVTMEVTGTSLPPDLDLDKKEEKPECCICLEKALHPVKLPCRHLFCFLCIKGCYLSDAKCPLCRGNIPKKCIEKPKLVDSEDKGKKSRKRKKSCTGGASKKSKNSVPAVANESSDASVSELPPELVWFYEGRNGGWWQYDERTEVLINQAVSKGENSLEVLLAGNVYVLDFVGRLQMLKSNPSVKRNMKQDVPNAPDTKGIAGLDMKS